jgi:hypothetical protein
MAKYPVSRIEWLLGISDEEVRTPTTLTKRENNGLIEIYSYALMIGESHADGTWWVHSRDSSATTNRHIDALTRVIEETHYLKEPGFWCPRPVDRKAWDDIMNGRGSKT